MATLSPEQLDELVLHLVIRRSYAERGSAEANAAEASSAPAADQNPTDAARNCACGVVDVDGFTVTPSKL